MPSISPPAASLSPQPPDPQAADLQRYATRVTISMILLCNTVIVVGIWATGIDLNRLIRTPDVFRPQQDVCVRLGWTRVDGTADPIRLCTEWINLSDPSGNTHRFNPGTKIIQDAAGKIYFDHGPMVDGRLLAYLVFAIAVVGVGVLMNRRLIARHRVRNNLL